MGKLSLRIKECQLPNSTSLVEELQEAFLRIQTKWFLTSALLNNRRKQRTKVIFKLKRKKQFQLEDSQMRDELQRNSFKYLKKGMILKIQC